MDTGPAAGVFILEDTTAQIGRIINTPPATSLFVLETAFAIDEAHSNNTAAGDVWVAQFADAFTARVAGVDVASGNRIQQYGARVIDFVGDEIGAMKSPEFAGGARVESPGTQFNITSFLPTPRLVEIGTIVTDVMLVWTYNTDPVTIQYLSGPGTDTDVPLDARQFEITGQAFDNNVGWQLDATHESGLTDTETCMLEFGALQFWGKSTLDDLTAADIVALSDNLLVSGKTSPIDFPATTSSQWMYFAYPAPYGELGRVVDPLTNFEIPTTYMGVRSVTNGQGYTVDYRLYRGVNRTGGTFTWTFQSNSGIQLPNP